MAIFLHTGPFEIICINNFLLLKKEISKKFHVLGLALMSKIF